MTGLQVSSDTLTLERGTLPALVTVNVYVTLPPPTGSDVVLADLAKRMAGAGGGPAVTVAESDAAAVWLLSPVTVFVAVPSDAVRKYTQE